MKHSFVINKLTISSTPPPPPPPHFPRHKKPCSVLTPILSTVFFALSALFSHTALAQTTTDYDTDDNQLIEISNLAQLNAIRWDLDGDGQVDSSSNSASYTTAFPDAQASMGCPSSGCIGYELTTDLDFDEDGDGAITETGDPTYWNGSRGWIPIFSSRSHFNATFEGNGNTISNLFINFTTPSETTRTLNLGLFGIVGTLGKVQNLGLKKVKITQSTNSIYQISQIGGLAGGNEGNITSCYVTGEVTQAGAKAPNIKLGGLVGVNGNKGKITKSYSTANVQGGGVVGGLVGSSSDSTIRVAYATGSAQGGHRVGGLVGMVSGGIIDSVYSIGRVRRTGWSRGGLIGIQATHFSGGASEIRS